MQIKGYAILAVFAIAVSVVSAAVLASGSSQALNDAMQHFICRTNFIVGLVNDTVAVAPNDSYLNTYASTLQSDTAQMQTYANNNDTADFRSYAHNTYDPDFRAARTTWSTAVAGLNSTQKSTLRADFASLHSTMQTCEFGALQDLAQQKVKGYNEIISDKYQKIAALSARGIDTSSLTQIVNNAQSQVVLPFQTAVNSATDNEQLRAALNQYCIFNDCPSGGVNFHLAANFDAAKLTLIIQKIESNPASANYTSQLNAAQNDVNTAKSVLAQVGTNEYSGSQSSVVWNNLRGAAVIIQNVLQQMSGIRAASSGSGVPVATGGS